MERIASQGCDKARSSQSRSGFEATSCFAQREAESGERQNGNQEKLERESRDLPGPPGLGLTALSWPPLKTYSLEQTSYLELRCPFSGQIDWLGSDDNIGFLVHEIRIGEWQRNHVFLMNFSIEEGHNFQEHQADEFVLRWSEHSPQLVSQVSSLTILM